MTHLREAGSNFPESEQFSQPPELAEWEGAQGEGSRQ